MIARPAAFSRHRNASQRCLRVQPREGVEKLADYCFESLDAAATKQHGESLRRSWSDGGPLDGVHTETDGKKGQPATKLGRLDK
jgi:hypothetical protein